MGGAARVIVLSERWTAHSRGLLAVLECDGVAAGYQPPEGWSVQAFSFALDPSPEQAQVLARQFGGRRYAYNWAVRQLKKGIEAYKAGVADLDASPPSLYGLRQRWNQEKSAECVDRETGEVWWPQISKEAFSCGIGGAVDAYWRWQKSRSGTLAGKRVGFPRFKRKGRDSDRFTVTTGTMRVNPDRRSVSLPKVGTVPACENTRRLERLISLGRARILAVTVRRHGTRVFAIFRVIVSRRPRTPARPDSVVGVDVGVRRLATVAAPDGSVIDKVPNPRALDRNLAELRHACRARSRRTPGSIRYQEANRQIARLHRRIADIRTDAISKLTTGLAKTHGTVVVETLNVAGMLQQKGLPGVRVRRRNLSGAGLGQIRRQLRYKQAWYGCRVVEADRFYPSSQICSACDAQTAIGWAEEWDCPGCGVHHHRDDNAAVNLARYPSSGWRAVGPVGSRVKRRADGKTGPGPARGDEAPNPNPDRGAA
jgi:putative transposase